MRWRRIIARHIARDSSGLSARVRDVRGCKLDLTGFPSPNVLIDVDACERESVDVATMLHGRQRCDFVIATGNHQALDVVFIEVTTSKFRRKMPNKIEQVVSSKEVFDELVALCEPKVTVKSFGGIVVSNIIPRSMAIQRRLNTVGAKSGMRMRLAKCGEDIWRAFTAIG